MAPRESVQMLWPTAATWQLMQQLKQLTVQKPAEGSDCHLNTFERRQKEERLLLSRHEAVTSFQIPAARLRALLQACLDDWCLMRGVQGGGCLLS